MASIGPAQSQEPGTSPRFPTWVAGAKAVGPSFIDHSDTLTGNWVGRRRANAQANVCI